MLRQDLENTVYKAAYDGPLVCTCALDQLHCTCFRSLANDASWRSLHRWNPTLCCGRKANIFSVFPSLNDAYSYTNTATGEEAIALVKVRWKLRWRSPEQTRVSCFFGFANVTNTFHACKRNAVHTSASKEQTLTNILWTVSLQAKKKKRETRPLKLPGILQRFSEAGSTSLGRRVGRIDKRSHFLDRAEPMGSSAQRWTRLRVWEISLQRSTPRSPWPAILVCKSWTQLTLPPLKKKFKCHTLVSFQADLFEEGNIIMIPSPPPAKI